MFIEQAIPKLLGNPLDVVPGCGFGADRSTRY